MVAQAICPSYAFGRRARFTKLDGCGRPIAGASSAVVTKAFTEVAITPNVLTGDEVSVKNAGGELCIADKALDSIKWFNVKITLCAQDPDLIQILNPTYFKELDANGNPIGFRVDTSTTYAAAFALELWMDVTGVDLCEDVNSQGGSGYLLLPFVQGGVIGDITVTNKEILTVFNGRTLPNPKWGLGPYNVMQDAAGDPSPLLTPVAATQPVVWFATTLAPPTPGCGAIAVPPMQLQTPPNPAVNGTPTTTAGSVKWDAVTGATGYTVTAVRHTTTTPILTGTVTGLTAAFTGLTTATTYDVKIVANGDGVNTLDSDPALVSFTTA
jgi:hypothetical protein